MPGRVYAPAFHHAVSIARSLPSLDVGLHYTLVGAAGLPVDHKAFVKAKFTGAFPTSRLTMMLRKQIDTLIEHGVAPSHIDSHQHLHALPSVMRVVARVASEYGIRVVRLPLERGDYAGASQARIQSSKILAMLCLVSRRELVRADIRFPKYFAGMAISGSLTPEGMIRLLRKVPEGSSEILCHPAVSNVELSKLYPWDYDWEGELAAVTDKTVIDTMKALDLSPSTFQDLA